MKNQLLRLALAGLLAGGLAAQAQTFSLGTSAEVVGPASGFTSIVLDASSPGAAWTASANVSWMQLSATNGAGSTNLAIQYSANTGATRTGTLTIAGQTLAITQAGAGYVAAQPLTTLVSGLENAASVTVDAAGNVYYSDQQAGTVGEWTRASDTTTPLVTNGLSFPFGLAVDASGNVFIADQGHSQVKEWQAATSNVVVVVSNTINGPIGLALDSAGDIYTADGNSSTVHEWIAANSNIVTIYQNNEGDAPYGVAVDAATNVYIAQHDLSAIYEVNATDNSLDTLVSSGLHYPFAVAVDGAGNVYIADTGDGDIKEWQAASGTVITLVSNLSTPSGLAVDGLGNIYYTQQPSGTVTELPMALVSAAAVAESSAAGNGALPPVLPVNENLSGPFAPASDQSWLTITGVTNGVVSFSFTANAGPARTAHITVLGQSVAVNQSGPPPVLGKSASLEGPAAGADSVVLSSPAGDWTAAANNPWLHLVDSSGTGSTNVIFDYDANTEPTRTGTLTIGGLTLTVTQAGSNYIQAPALLTSLVTNGLNEPQSVAVDPAGNVYIADTQNNAVEKWIASNNTLTTLIPSLSYPGGVALDPAGNVFIGQSDTILEWTVADSNLSILVGFPTIYSANGLALDPAGNVYFVDTFRGLVDEWQASDSNVVTLISNGLHVPNDLAVDVAGNVYVADTDNNAIKELTAGATNVIVLDSSLTDPEGVAVDGAGNVYIADTFASRIQEWIAASNTVITLASSGLDAPYDVAVDATGNLFIADGGTNAVDELPRAFLDPRARMEPNSSGSDSLPAVLPVSQNFLPPFAPASDQSWLAITGVSNGVVSFSFAGNPGATRTAHISLLGQSIAVSQGASLPQIGVFDGTLAITNGQTNPISFGAVIENADGPVLTFTVTNNGAAALTVSNIALPGGYTLVTNAPSTIAVGSNGAFSVQLDTAAAGTFAGSVFITNNDPANGVFSFAVAGSVVAAPQITVAAGGVSLVNGQTNAVNFGNVPLDGTGSVVAFTISNSGTAPLDVSNISVPAGYDLAPDYPTNVAVGGNGQFLVHLTPGPLGLHTGDIVISNSDSANNPFIIPITGVVFQTNIVLSGNLDFGVVPLGSSASNTLVISNGGSITLNVSNINYPAPGVFSGNWSNGAIAPGAIQSVGVTFIPAVPTNYSGVLTVVSDAGNATLPVAAFGANTNLVLTLITNGDGKITPNDAKFIKLGTHVSLTAVPGKTSVFASWTGSFASTNNPLKFTMASNTIVQANFVTNPFLPFVGVYNGLFSAPGGVTETNAGMLKGLAVTSKGTFSGSLLLDGVTKAVTGSFNIDRQAAKSVVVSKTAGTVVLSLSLISNQAAPQIVGVVSNAGWVATNLVADLAVSNSAVSSAYTALIESSGTSGAPIGDGYALITGAPGNAKTAASAKISGSLADGTAFSQTTSVSADGYAPLYANLYAGKGLVLGWINLTSNAPGGSLTWVHPVRPGLFANAFVSTNDVALSPWTNPPAAESLPTNLTVIQAGGLIPLATNSSIIAISNNLKVGLVSGTNAVSGAVTAKTGLIKLTIGAGSSKVTATGVLLLNATNGGGYILNKTSAGAMQLGQ